MKLRMIIEDQTQDEVIEEIRRLLQEAQKLSETALRGYVDNPLHTWDIIQRGMLLKHCVIEDRRWLEDFVSCWSEELQNNFDGITETVTDSIINILRSAVDAGMDLEQLARNLVGDVVTEGIADFTKNALKMMGAFLSRLAKAVGALLVALVKQATRDAGGDARGGRGGRRGRNRQENNRIGANETNRPNRPNETIPSQLNPYIVYLLVKECIKATEILKRSGKWSPLEQDADYPGETNENVENIDFGDLDLDGGENVEDVDLDEIVDFDDVDDKKYHLKPLPQL